MNEVLESGLTIEDVRTYLEFTHGTVLEIEEEDSFNNAFRLLAFFTPILCKYIGDNIVLVRFYFADSVQNIATEQKISPSWSLSNLPDQLPPVGVMKGLGINALMGFIQQIPQNNSSQELIPLSKEDTTMRPMTPLDSAPDDPQREYSTKGMSNFLRKSIKTIGMSYPGQNADSNVIHRLTTTRQSKLKTLGRTITIANRLLVNDDSLDCKQSTIGQRSALERDHSLRMGNPSTFKAEDHNADMPILEKELSRRIYLLPDKSTFSLKCIILLLLSILPLISQFSVGLVKLDIKFEVYREIRTKLIYIDRSSWAIWAVVQFMQGVDNTRLILDGLIAKDIYAIWNVPDLLESEQSRLGLYVSQIITYQRQVDLAMLNTTFKTDYLRTPLNFHIRTYEYDTEGKWKTVLRKPSEAVALIQPPVDAYILNTNLSTLEGGPVIWEDRDLDLTTEFFRKNIQGDFQAYTSQVCDLVKSYFLGITAISYQVSIWSQFSNAIALSATVAFMLVGFLVWGCYTRRRLLEELILKPDDMQTAQSLNSQQLKRLAVIQNDTKEAFIHPTQYFQVKLVKEHKEVAHGKKSKLNPMFKKRPNYARRGILKNEGFLFPGVGLRLLILLGLLCAAAALELFTALGYIREVKRVQNMIFVYAATIDMWNTAFLMQQATESAIIWGNNIKITEIPALDAAKNYREFFEKVVLRDFSNTRNMDLGNFTADYNRIVFGEHSLCDDLRDTKGEKFVNCGEGVSAFIDDSYFTIIRKTNALFDQVQQSLEVVIEDKYQRLNIMSETTYSFYRAYNMQYDEFWTEIYYRTTIPLIRAMDLIINKDKSLENNLNPDKEFYIKMYGGILTVCGILVAYLFVFPVLRIIALAKTISMLIPLELHLSNKLFVQRLKRKSKLR